ncbi:hypothetical protein KUCAC02_012753 [Scomber scombrus]|uniref:Uncharacterized protein n=1 Tax=Scomber scombrus TaxID=13677 RepID=A0AAV1Q503_SCOSC
MSDQFQSNTLELSSTIDLSESVIATLSDKRAEESWVDLHDRAVDLCTKACVSQDRTCEKRQAQPPRILQEFVVEAPVERTPVTTPDALHTHFYYPVIDRLTHLYFTDPAHDLCVVRQSFSCLRRIKNFLRNSSGDNRNSNLALLSINKQRTKTLDVQRIIDIFASNHKNRRIVLI